MSLAGIFNNRRAGVILHPTSLPDLPDRSFSNNSNKSRYPNGDFGPSAYRFLDFMRESGLSIWQLLPLSPTHEDFSPYMGLSVFAGNTRLISIDQLIEWQWLDEQDLQLQSDDASQYKQQLIAVAGETVMNGEFADIHREYDLFVNQQQFWLDDFALFEVLRREFKGECWYEWPASYRDRDEQTLKEVRKRLKRNIDKVYFEQFVFFRQWRHLHEYAAQRNIIIYGDMPIFVAYDSAEVWAWRKYFDLNDDGSLRTVAGVPPDYFSETGQRWGNPLYRWDEMEADEFKWWKERMRVALGLYDVIRIDHFRGFEAYWEIEADEDTAINGRWVKAPGDRLFDTLLDEFETLPIIVEDLGIITPDVEALRDKYGWPGMKILQFAFDGNADNPYLPHNFGEHCVVYSGTHDNNTTLGWYESLPGQIRENVLQYLNAKTNDMPWPIIECALDSSARWAIFPMQDLLGLDSSGRMNTPGVSEGSWQWRFDWSQVPVELADRLYSLLTRYRRITGN